MAPPDDQPPTGFPAQDTNRSTVQPSTQDPASLPPAPVDGDENKIKLPTHDHKEIWVREWRSEQAALTALNEVCLRDMVGEAYSKSRCKRDDSCHAVFHICLHWLFKKDGKMCTESHPVHIEEGKKLVAHIPPLCKSLLKKEECQKPKGKCLEAHIGAEGVYERMEKRNASLKTAGDS